MGKQRSKDGSSLIHAGIPQMARLRQKLAALRWPKPCLVWLVDTPKQSNVDWVKCYYDAFNRRDWEWISAMLAPDVEWFHAARDERVRGVNAVISSFRSLVEGTSSAQIDVRAVHDAGLIVIAECGIRHSRRSVPPLSKPASNRPAPPTPPSFCEVLQLQGGRCIRGSTYADSVRLLMDISQSAAA